MEKLNRLSANLPAFLRRYPPAEGYSVQTEILDGYSVRPGLMRLYEIALHGGHPPESLGLPPLRSSDHALIGRATLRDPQGRILATATAASVTPDLESLETAARPRLLAALGWGGESSDEDEAIGPGDPGLAITAAVPAPVPATETRAESRADTAPVPPVDEGVAVATSALPPGEDSVTTGAASVDSAPATPVETPAAAPSHRVAADAAIPAEPPLDRALPLLQRQITHLARLRGVAAPDIHTRAEGQAALKVLMQQPTATVG